MEREHIKKRRLDLPKKQIREHIKKQERKHIAKDEQTIARPKNNDRPGDGAGNAD